MIGYAAVRNGSLNLRALQITATIVYCLYVSWFHRTLLCRLQILYQGHGSRRKMSWGWKGMLLRARPGPSGLLLSSNTPSARTYFSTPPNGQGSSGRGRGKWCKHPPSRPSGAGERVNPIPWTLLRTEPPPRSISGPSKTTLVLRLPA